MESHVGRRRGWKREGAMRARRVFVLATVALLVLRPLSAVADGWVGLSHSSWEQGGNDNVDGPGQPASAPVSTGGHVVTYAPECVLTGISACDKVDMTCPVPGHEVRYAVLIDGVRSGETVCFTDQQVAQRRQVTGVQVLHAVRRYGWRAPDLHVQPGAGWTLVNLATNVYTTLSGMQEKSFSLLGHRIVVQAGPRSYRWGWGDGASAVTGSPGRRVESDRGGRADLNGCVTHTYRRRAQGLTLSVTAVYGGWYRVDGGRWQQLPGTLDVAGQSVSLDVDTATPVLVS